jgi:hypothetical protein
MSLKSYLGFLQPQAPLSKLVLFEKKQKAWKEDRILVVTPEQMTTLSNKEHEAVVSIGKKLYEPTPKLPKR